MIMAVLLAFTSRLMSQTTSEDPKLIKIFDKSMTIAKFVALKDDDFWKSAKALMYQNQGFEDGHGMYAWHPAMKQFPKRVALLSYIVFDPGLFEVTSKRIDPCGILSLVKTESGFLSAKSTKELAQGLYEMSIAAMKAEFGNYGSVLLTPDEYLSGDGMRSVYTSFDFKEKGLAKMMSSEGSANTIAVPSGYVMYYAENATMPAFVDAVNAKIKELGVDAGLIVKIQMGANNGQVCIQSVNVAMYGPNPVPKNPDKKYIAINAATGYHEGVVYNAVKLGAFDTDNMLETKEGLNLLVLAQNKAGMRSDFTDFDKLMARAAAGVNYPVNMWITGGWKPFKYKK
jgi:hypothetical protein